MPFKLLTLKPGYDGGSWEVDGVPLKRCTDHTQLRIKGKIYQAEIVSIIGYDSDHGHRYEWSNYDFVFRVDTPVGRLLISLRRHKLRAKVYLLVEDEPGA
jgi:hypothetical protein